MKFEFQHSWGIKRILKFLALDNFNSIANHWPNFRPATFLIYSFRHTFRGHFQNYIWKSRYLIIPTWKPPRKKNICSQSINFCFFCLWKLKWTDWMLELPFPFRFELRLWNFSDRNRGFAAKIENGNCSFSNKAVVQSNRNWLGQVITLSISWSISDWL